jgi:hypothetical protein
VEVVRTPARHQGLGRIIGRAEDGQTLLDVVARLNPTYRSSTSGCLLGTRTRSASATEFAIGLKLRSATSGVSGGLGEARRGCRSRVQAPCAGASSTAPGLLGHPIREWGSVSGEPAVLSRRLPSQGGKE